MHSIKELKINKLFFIIIFIFELSKEDIINNPILISNNPNPIILTSSTQYIIFTSGKRIIMEKETGNIVSTSSLVEYTKPYVLCSDESNNYYIYWNRQLTQIIPSVTTISYNTQMNFPTSTQYVGFIKEKGTTGSSGWKKGAKCQIASNEMIIYGKSTSKIMFSFLRDNSYKTFSLSSNLEDQMSCKIMSSCQYLCAIIRDNRLDLFALMYSYSNSGSCEIIEIGSATVSSFSKHTKVTLYDTNVATTKLACARNITSSKIECIYVICNIEETESTQQYTYHATFSGIPITASIEVDSSSNGDCSLTSFNNENILCCGGTNSVKCTRFNNDHIINSFHINMRGVNTDVKFVNTQPYASLFFVNEFNSQTKLYDHYIYPPHCTEMSYTIIANHNLNEDKIGNEDSIKNFFTRKTNTNYYIKFENLPQEYGYLTIDDQVMDTSKILINDSYPYILDILSTNTRSVNHHQILYTISIDETYSAQCTINLTILPCYISCEKCSTDASNSNDEEHNCFENYCKEGYYVDPTKSTNCFMISEKKDNWYFDYDEYKFGLCYNKCATCDGPSSNNCLSCHSASIDPNYAYLYNKECISSCPEGTYPESIDGYYKCNPCYVNCKTCSSYKFNNNMNCDTCEDNYIHYLKNCYREADPLLKTFYLPESTETSSCYQSTSYYIKENTYECISSIPEGYFVSNTETGLISPCHEDCKTCSIKYTEGNTNCDICLNQDYNYLDGNCVETCPEGYYTYENNSANNKKTCKKCYNYCQKCNQGATYENSLVTNMNCIQCKKEPDSTNPSHLIDKYIQNEGNCFPIITYTNEKILFNVSEINTAEMIKSCLDFGKGIKYTEYKCISKPSNTYYVLDNEENTGIFQYCDVACSSCNRGKNLITLDTNCIDCTTGYYKTEDSNTNCILESLIHENYYKNPSDNIYYHCYTSCKKCSDYYDSDTNNMNCLECINDYFFIYGTNNCYDISLAENNQYFLSSEDNKFHKCYYSCNKCSGESNENNHNCINCINDYYFEENTNNCCNMTYIEKGYYFDDFTISGDELPLFKKCYEKCQKCNDQLIGSNMNCELCIENHYKINGTNNCYNDELLSQGYYLKDNLFFPCEENCLTCSYSRTITDGIESNNCLSCDKINKGLYLVDDLKNCEPIGYKENGYYLQEDINGNEIFYKCYHSCSQCERGLVFDASTNQENHNCLTCAENYYKLKNDLNPQNCYGDEMISLNYYFVRGFWTICHENCEDCDERPVYNENNELISQNCGVCFGDLHFIYQTKDCANDSLLEKGYYFDDNDLQYHECDIQCKKCEKYSTSTDPKCLECNNEKGYYLAEDKPTSNCYNSRTINISDYFLLTSVEEGKNISRWTLIIRCFSTCASCLYSGDEIKHNCLSCKSDYHFIYNTSNCITEEYAKDNNYYLNASLEQYVKCDKACMGCFGDKETNCILCNENEEYYLINGKDNSSCYNSETIMEGYFLDIINTPYKWSVCYDNCATCEYKGNSKKMLCLSCKTNVISPIYNKVIYFKFSNGNCIEGCPDDLFLTQTGDCVEICPESTYEFLPNNSCVNSCPSGYELNNENTRCVETVFTKTITSSEFKDIISDDISNYIDSDTVIDGSDFKAIIISSSDLDPIEQIKKGISGLDMGNCIDKLKEVYKIPSDEDLIVVEIESKEDKEKNKNLDKKKDRIDLGKEVQILICDYSGRILEMSHCDQEIVVMKYVGDVEGININSAMEYSEQGIDIFNPEDSFFNDICHPFNGDTDIVLGDRRTDLFQNVSFCGDNCKYNGMNYELMTANCNCNPGGIQIDKEDSEVYGDENSQGITLNDLANSFTSELLDFNYIVITCYNLVFNQEILKRNVGFFSLLSMNGLQIIFLIVFFTKFLKPIKNYMLVYEPFDPNIDPPNPPKSKKAIFSFTKENDNINNIHINALLDRNNNSYKHMNKKEKEIQKSILINNLLSKSTKKEGYKHHHNNNDNYEDNDDALIVHYISSEDSKSIRSHYKKMDNNKKTKSKFRRADSDSNSERDKRKSTKSINQKMKNKRIIHLKGNDSDDDNTYSGYKSSSFEAKNKSNESNESDDKNSEREKNNYNPKSIIIFSRNKDRGKDLNSKYSSTFGSNKLTSERQELEMFDTPLSINEHKSRRIIHSKYVSPLKKKKNKNEDIIFEKIEDDEDYENSRHNDKNRKKYNYENLYKTINKKRIMKTKLFKNPTKVQKKNQIASNEDFLSDGDDNDDENKKKLKNYLSLHKKNKNKKVKIQIGKTIKKEHYNKGILKRNYSTKSEILTTGYNDEKKNTESNLNENKKKDNKKLGNMRLYNKKVHLAYTNDDYNEMNYEKALHKDNRTFLKILTAILIEEHIILNTFCTDVYLELRAIKLSFLVFSIEISFFLNAFFYTDEYISDTYHNNGVVDFFSSLPKSIYSFLVSLILANLLKMLSTSKRQLLKIIKEVNDKQYYLYLLEKELKRLRIKLIIYFSIIFLLGTFFLYYCAAFCAVYTNSQMFWFYGCLESLAMDLSTPILICLVLATFRYIGLRKHIKCLYLTSIYLGYLF